MDEVIDSFQTQLLAYVPVLKEVGEDWGQCDFYNEMPPVKFPCVLIDIQNAQYSDTGGLRQQGTLTVVLRLFVLRLSNNSNAAPEGQKNNAKRGWTACRDIVKAIHGQDFIKNGFAAPIRTQMNKPKRRDGIYERDIVFSIGFTDTSCVPIKTHIKPTVSLAASIQ